MRDWYYIVGTDCAVRKSGQVRQQPLFDGPHPTEESAHELARQMVVAGEYEVLTFPTPSRDTARQTYNHDLALKVGAGQAMSNKFQLKPKNQAKAEKDAAWGR